MGRPESYWRDVVAQDTETIVNDVAASVAIGLGIAAFIRSTIRSGSPGRAPGVLKSEGVVSGLAGAALPVMRTLWFTCVERLTEALSAVTAYWLATAAAEPTALPLVMSLSTLVKT